MNPQRYQQVKEVFAEVCRLDPSERPERLEALCGGDADLVAEVQGLLDHDGQSLPMRPRVSAAAALGLQSEVAGGRSAPPTGIAPPSDFLPERIGHFSVKRKIGEGGMGIVYEAEQDNPRRIIALKVIRSGIAPDRLLHRFRLEAFVLGRLQHPGIAQIYEAGTAHVETRDGQSFEQPYFAMELIRGKPLLHAADEMGLNTRHRLELIARVCDAVQHAHQKGVIHRDLKPGNILVVAEGQATSDEATERPRGSRDRRCDQGLTAVAQETQTRAPTDDGRTRQPGNRPTAGAQAPSSSPRRHFVTSSPRHSSILAQPKILDFGVARVTDSDIQLTTLHTDVGQLIGTIPYMSPEQISGDSHELDTRSDVYALGVILYEILVGRHPYELAGKSIPEASRAIAEEQPARMSSFDTRFRGELDIIVGKALEKEKERRYQSAAEFAADIRRHLNDEPITARPASSLYQLRKFARRNRGLVGGMVVAFLALIIGLVGTASQAIRATRERDRWVAAERLAEQRRSDAEARRAEATAEAEKSLAINEFMQRMLSSVDPASTLGRDVPFRAFLDQAAQRIETDVPDHPEVQAAIHNTLGRTYRNLGLLDEAQSHLRIALGLCDDLLGVENELTLAVMNNLALTLQDQRKLQEAESLYRKVLELRNRLQGERHPHTILAMNNLGWLLTARGELAEAEELFRRSLSLGREISGADDPETLRTQINLAKVVRDSGKKSEGGQLVREAFEACRAVLGAEHPTTLYAMEILVWTHKQAGNLKEAEALGRPAVELHRQVLGEDHRLTFVAMNNLGVVLADLRQFDEAERMHRDTLDRRRRVFGDGDPATLESMNNLATVLHERGEPAAAIPLYIQVWNARCRILGEDHPATISAMTNLALGYQAAGKPAEATSLLTEAVSMRRRRFGDGHPQTLALMIRLARFHVAQDQIAEAERLFAGVLSSRRERLGGEHHRTLQSMNNLATVYFLLGRFDDAESLYREAWETRRRVLGNEHRATLWSMAKLSLVHHRQNRLEEAEHLYTKTIELCHSGLGAEHQDSLLYMRRLADVYRDQGRFDKAAPLLRKTLEGCRRTLGDDHRETLACLSDLTTSLLAWEKFDAAEQCGIEYHDRCARIHGPEHAKTRQAVERLVELYQNWNRPSEAEAWGAKLDAADAKKESSPDAEHQG